MVIGGMHLIADAFVKKLNDALDIILPILTNEILEKKQSYFSEKGKQGWAPLKADTIKRKSKKYPAHVSDFNTASGALRDSIKIEYNFDKPNALTFTINATHGAGDKAIKGLIYDYGRDFLNFDETESQWIIQRLKELLINELR
jgi:hypothetical protein